MATVTVISVIVKKECCEPCLARVRVWLIDWSKLYAILVGMSEPTRKVTVNLPEAELEAAMKLTGKGVTLTLIEGLRELERKANRSALRKLRGAVDIELNLAETRK